MVRSNRVLAIFIMLLLPILAHSLPQESRVNQKKIEKERAKKQKQALKDYNDAVKRHNKNQSKSTRSNMKRTKKESKKMTPSMH